MEDVVGEDNPDPLSIMTYVSQLYHGLAPHRGRVGAVHSLMFCRERDKPIERDNTSDNQIREVSSDNSSDEDVVAQYSGSTSESGGSETELSYKISYASDYPDIIFIHLFNNLHDLLVYTQNS